VGRSAIASTQKIIEWDAGTRRIGRQQQAHSCFRTKRDDVIKDGGVAGPANAHIHFSEFMSIDVVSNNFTTVDWIVVSDEIDDRRVSLGRGRRLLNLVIKHLALVRSVTDKEPTRTSSVVIEGGNVRRAVRRACINTGSFTVRGRTKSVVVNQPRICCLCIREVASMIQDVVTDTVPALLV